MMMLRYGVKADRLRISVVNIICHTSFMHFFKDV